MPTTAMKRETMQCQLTQDELFSRLEEHRAAVNALRELDEERKFVMRQLAERKKRLQAEEVRLDAVCNQKWENRDVELLVELHKPVVGQKTFTRTDTGEMVRIEEMSDDEKQENLFDEKQEFEKVVADVPPPNPFAASDQEPAPAVPATEAPAEVAAVQEAEPEVDRAASEIVGSCQFCGKDVPKFALDEGKCAFCEKTLQKCETCGGYLFDDRVIHSLEKCAPRPVEADDEGQQ